MTIPQARSELPAEQEKRDRRFEQQTGDLYRAIGKFSVQFEHMRDALETGIIWLLAFHGLKKQSVADALVAGLTARPLTSLFESLCAETRALNPVARKIFDNVTKRIRRMIDRRNEILHARWFVGWASPSDTDFSTVAGYKRHKDKRGTRHQVFHKDARYFDELSSEAEELSNVILRLSGCLTWGHDIETNFRVDSDGTVRLPSKSSDSSIAGSPESVE